MGWIEQWGMRGVSGASNQDPSEYCAEVRRGRKGQRNWRAEGPKLAIQTSVTPLLAAFRGMSSWEMPRQEFYFTFIFLRC